MAKVLDPNIVVPPEGTILKLCFDPKKTADQDLKAVFKHRFARNLWLGIRWRHIVSQYFTNDCLQIGRLVKKYQPKTAQELRSFFFYGQDPNFRGAQDTLQVCEQLLPYMTGEKDFEFIINETSSAD